MIFHCSYEELNALRRGAHVLLEGGGEGPCAVAAPPVDRVRVETLLARLRGDLTMETLGEQEALEEAVTVIVECLQVEMNVAVTSLHPAHEEAVAAYFEYAHALAVLERIREVGREMADLIELVTGDQPTPEMVESFHFPD